MLADRVWQRLKTDGFRNILNRNAYCRLSILQVEADRLLRRDESELSLIDYSAQKQFRIWKYQVMQRTH